MHLGLRVQCLCFCQICAKICIYIKNFNHNSKPEFSQKSEVAVALLHADDERTHEETVAFPNALRKRLKMPHLFGSSLACADKTVRYNQEKTHQ